jgi:hypothetical protein
LFFDIATRADAGVTSALITATNASTLAAATISNRPYSRLSDLHKITATLVNATNHTPPLLVNVTAGTLTNASSVLDRAREEVFGKIVELATVQSRAFRVYVVGESLGPRQKPLGRAALEAVVALPVDLAPTNTPTVRIQRWEN